MSTQLENWAAEFAARGPGLPGGDLAWLQAARKHALERFLAEGWPTPRQEAWRHTSLAPLAGASFKAGATLPLNGQLQSLQASSPGHFLVFVDGAFAPELSTLSDLPQSVVIAPWSEALANHADLIQSVFGQAQDGHSPSALNLALAADGALVYLKRGAVLEQILNIVCLATDPQAASFLRHFIVAEQGAQATVVEHYQGVAGAANLTSTSTRLHLAEDANIIHLKMQLESPKAWHLGEVVANQDRHSYLATHSISLGARLARHDIVANFHDERCETLLNGLYFVDQRRHVDHQTMIGHHQPNCVSHEYYRGIMADSAHGVFTGRILVAPGADGTDAIQRNDSLLLSRLAKSDARPELEIYADDVKCAHGATVGQIDADSLFYLKSRGIDEAQARDILIYAFAASGLTRIQSEPLRTYAEQAVRAMLPGNVLVEAA